VTQSIAEALCAIALFQYVRPGIPCVIGTFTSNVDMKTGAPAFGTAEYMRATQMTGQMGRFYKLPIRSSGVCAANVPDGQAMWETSNSLWAAVQSGSNVVYHAAGWLEGGLIASPEKFIMDCEVLQLIQRYFEPVITRTEPEDIAIEAIKEVGSSGHFLAFSIPKIAMKLPSTNPSSAIGVIMKDGNWRVVFGRLNGPRPNTKRSWPIIRNRPWIRPFTKNCGLSSIVGSPKAGHQLTFDCNYTFDAIFTETNITKLTNY
jgi:hypothetical protein